MSFPLFSLSFFGAAVYGLAPPLFLSFPCVPVCSLPLDGAARQHRVSEGVHVRSGDGKFERGDLCFHRVPRVLILPLSLLGWSRTFGSVSHRGHSQWNWTGLGLRSIFVCLELHFFTCFGARLSRLFDYWWIY